MTLDTLETPDADAPDSTVMIVPWHDPIVDKLGYDVRSHYVELFWLNVLGPTATWILRRLVLGLDHYPLGYELDLAETANALGLAYKPGVSNPFVRALNRCSMFGVAQPAGAALAVRRRVPPVARRHLSRMPDHLRTAHEQWTITHTTLPVPDLHRARVLAEAMLAVGDDAEVVERQLLAVGVPPLCVNEVLDDAR